MSIRKTSVHPITIHMSVKAILRPKHERRCSDPEEEHDDFDSDAEDGAHGGAAGEGVAVEVVRYYCVERYCEGEDCGDDCGGENISICGLEGGTLWRWRGGGVEGVLAGHSPPTARAPLMLGHQPRCTPA